MKLITIPLLALTLSAVGVHSDSSRPQITLRSGGVEITQSSSAQIEEKIKACRASLAELVQSNAMCMNHFDAFANHLDQAYSQEGVMTTSDIDQILSAVSFAAEKHKLQVRKNAEKTPYISHPIGVALHLMDIGQVRDVSVIIGALLHDTIEDTETTYSEIETLFGKDVANYVKEVTDDKSLAREQRKRGQIISAAKKSVGAAQIKLADKFYNLTDLFENPPPDWTRERIDQYYQWAKSVVDRLPASNQHLKDAIQDLIHNYWEKQGNPEKSS
ncbi:MAG: HD domain-containing protein [Rhabdochlamydiaceae bacterium]|nr:HD domain-containing protein [Rhabdochlamydiaceae bacterium]